MPSCRNLTETAAELTGARYAALGVIDPNRSELEHLVTTGLDPETIARIGDLPRGREILGVLIGDARRGEHRWATMLTLAALLGI